MENNSKLVIKKKTPLRGKVELQSSLSLASFFITLSLLNNAKTRYTGTFLNNTVYDYLTILKSHGYNIKNDVDNVYTDASYNVTESTYFSELDLHNKFLVILSLSKKGYAEIKENKEMVDFLKYMGFVVKVKDNIYTVYNKIETQRESITFYNINVDYFLLSVLAFSLNYNKYSISISDTTYEINLLLEELKKIGFVEDINYSNFVNISFNTSSLEESLDAKIEIPKDPTEFIFFSLAALGTNGEIEIEGINPKHLANSLKIFADLGAGYDSVASETIRIWGTSPEHLKNIIVSSDISYLEFTKLCLMSIIPLINKQKEEMSKIEIDHNIYKSLVQDINMLGGSLDLQENAVLSVSKDKYKSGTIYLYQNKEKENYVRILLALIADEEIEIENYNYFSKCNSQLLEKLIKLGANIQIT